ncbi:hypothetical protein ZYGR_0AK03320 [Zygosaccharomyces rouxii]|uniref:GPI transamidase component GPI16 n=1 Tax=Zygosaccharomyces rouxii TaxID=4956 RepID=A0A1Q3ADV5_ZYGRO|nr:hypothetical protein ZYGR_0AK03320 [Zygosaccharomyces rouxii]
MRLIEMVQLIGIAGWTGLLSSVLGAVEAETTSSGLELDQDIDLRGDFNESLGDHKYSCNSGLVFNDGGSETEIEVTETVIEDAPQPTIFLKREDNDSIIVEDQIWYPYREHLSIKPLPKNYLLTSFDFDTQSNEFVPGKPSTDFDDYSHYTVFPKAFKPILDQTSTRQLHLRFTRGFWDAESWGRLPHNGFESGGSGVEVWAILEADSKDSAFRQWKTLVNSLSGLFCASMNFIDGSKTTFPVESFHPLDDTTLPLFDQNKKLYLIRAALANEPICTENLTPLLKLFPTKGKSGITTLLDGHKVFDSSWHSLSVDISTDCYEQTDRCSHTLRAHVDMVINVPKTLARSENPIPKPLPGDKLRCDLDKPYDAFHCFQLPYETEGSYSLSQLFGKQIQGSSLMSEEPSQVCVEIADNWNSFIQVNGSLFATTDNCFELKDFQQQDIYFESNNTNEVVDVEPVPVYVSRSLTGYGQDRGGLRTVFVNPQDEPVTLIYFESLPWFMRIYLSTMHLENNPQSPANISLDDILQSTYYMPAADRVRPTHLEYRITIPANTTLAVSYQFDKSLLQYAEYPPDANHGFEIESAVITVIEPTTYQLRTATLLLLLSTPDFSMPYNVIILTSTVMGLIFGTLFNLLVKKMLPVEEADKIQEGNNLKNKIQTLKGRMLAKFNLNRQEVKKDLKE